MYKNIFVGINGLIIHKCCCFIALKPESDYDCVNLTYTTPGNWLLTMEASNLVSLVTYEYHIKAQRPVLKANMNITSTAPVVHGTRKLPRSESTSIRASPI